MKSIYFSLLFISTSSTAIAQATTNAAGATNTVGSTTIDWSFGELTLVEEKRSGSLIVSQGLLQPEKGIFTESTDAITSSELKVLPNPTSGLLQIQASFLIPGKLRFEFFDAKGSRIITEEKLYTGFNTYQFDLDRYAAASYPLKVSWMPANGKSRMTKFIIIKQ